MMMYMNDDKLSALGLLERVIGKLNRHGALKV